jgi:hypothetical protein
MVMIVTAVQLVRGFRSGPMVLAFEHWHRS